MLTLSLFVPPLCLLPPPRPPLVCRSRPGVHRLPQGCNHDAFSYTLGNSLLHYAAAAWPRQSGKQLRDVCLFLSTASIHPSDRRRRRPTPFACHPPVTGGALHLWNVPNGFSEV